jgi:hypothetical protein
MKFDRPKLDALLLTIGVSLLPIYVFASGGVQPAHLVLALFAGSTLVVRGVPLVNWALLLLALAIYALLVEGFYVAGSGEPGALLNGIYYFYNCFLAASIFQHVRTFSLRPIAVGVLIAASIALLTVLMSGVDMREMGEGGRSTATFNNPNQLGFFSVCLLSISYLLFREGQLRFIVALGLFSVAVYLAIVSLSKAAMVANFVVVGIALKPRAHSRYAMTVWVLAAMVGVVAILDVVRGGGLDELLFMQRLNNMMEENDSSLESRGYLAFLDGNAAQWVFGLGSQRVSQIVGHEVHSTLGSIFNNYGIVGALLTAGLFAIWAVQLFRSYGFAGLACIAGPAMLYGITHNGTRFTMFWLLLSASMAAANARERRKVRRGASFTRGQPAPPLLHGERA